MRSALSICTKVIPGLPDPLWPAKIKNGQFWVFLEFWPIKKYANVKIGDSHIKGLSTSFNLIPNLSGLDRAEPSYDPLTVPGSENFFLNKFTLFDPEMIKSKNNLGLA